MQVLAHVTLEGEDADGGRAHLSSLGTVLGSLAPDHVRGREETTAQEQRLTRATV